MAQIREYKQKQLKSHKVMMGLLRTDLPTCMTKSFAARIWVYVRKEAAP
jgi:hypothetical protein